MAQVSARADLAACPGARIVGRAALEASGLSIADIGDSRTVVDTMEAALIARMESVEMCGASVRLQEDHAFTI